MKNKMKIYSKKEWQKISKSLTHVCTYHCIPFTEEELKNKKVISVIGIDPYNKQYKK